MANPIKLQDLKKVYDQTIKSLNSFLSVYNSTIAQIKQDSEIIKKNVSALDKATGQGIANINKELEKTETLVQKRIKTDKDLKKTQDDLNKASIQRKKILIEAQKVSQEAEKTAQQKVKTQELLRRQSISIRKEDEKTRKQQEQLNSVYAQESKRLNKLRKDYKDLVVGKGKATKESRKLKREIDKLDKSLKDVDAEVGQFQRSIGQYPKTLGDASAALIKMAAAAAVGGALKAVDSSLQVTEEGSKDLATVTAGLGAAWEVTQNTIAGVALDIKDSFLGLINPFNAVSESFSRTRKNLSNYVEDVENLAEADGKAALSSLALRKELRGLNVEIEELTVQINNQLAIAGDSTKSFKEIGAAAEEASRLEVQRVNKLVEIVEREKAVIDEQLRVRGNTTIQNNQLLDLQAEKEKELVALRGELSVQQLEISKVITENRRDLFEREEDFAIDAFDTIKTINERRIADERKTLEEREAILKRTVELGKKSFSEQQRLVEEFTGRRLELNELIKIDDEKEIRRRLKLADFDDITAGVILTIIRDRKTAIQDLTEAEQDLLDVRNETQQQQQNIQSQEDEIKLLEDRLEGRVASEEEFNEKALELTIDRLEKEIELLDQQGKDLEEGSEKQLENQEEINDKEIELLEAKIEREEELKDKQAEEDEKRAERQKELIEESISLIESIGESIFDKRLSQLDKELEKNLDNQDRIQDAINNGSKDASKSLAEEEKREAKIEAKRRENEDRRLKFEAAIAGLKLLASNGGDLAETASDISGLFAIIGQLTGFYEGADRVGDGNSNAVKHSSGRDGFVAKLDGKEMVLNGDQTSDLSSMYGINTRQDIFDMAERGTMSVNTGGALVVAQSNNKGVEERLDKLDHTISKLKLESNLFIDTKYIREEFKSEKRTETRKRISNSWV